MDLQLKGKRALVTGSSSGIGAAIAKTLAREGASVVIQGRKQAEAERVAQEIIANGASSVVAIGDFTFGWNYDVFADTSKSRRFGFHEFVDTEEMFLNLFSEFQRNKIIPTYEG